jgi:hypothetical protein
MDWMAEQEVAVVAPKLGEWQYFAAEETHRSQRNDMPNLRMANIARRHLAAVVHELSERNCLVGWHELDDLTVADVHRLATTELGLLGVRAASSAITLVISGYAVEAGVHLRRLIECTLRSRALLDDNSGENARMWLRGRARPSAARLANRYGNEEELNLLSIVAHADRRGVALLHADDLSADGIATVPLMPHRSRIHEEAVLYGLAYESGMLSAGLAQAFGVAVQFPGWLSGELHRARERLSDELDATG